MAGGRNGYSNADSRVNTTSIEAFKNKTFKKNTKSEGFQNSAIVCKL